MVAGAVLLADGIEVVLVATPPPGPGWANELYPAAALVYAAAGLVAWWRRPSNRIGAIMLAGALVWLAAALAMAADPLLAAAGTVLATVPLAVVVHLLVAFPSGQLTSTLSRWLAVLAYPITLVLQMPRYLFAPGASPGGILAVADRPDLAAWGLGVQDAIAITGMLITAALLTGALRRATRPQRRILGPLYVYGIIAVLFIPFSAQVLAPLTALSPNVTGGLQVAVLAGVPVAFAVALLRGGFARMSEVQELSAWLSTADTARGTLAFAIARALGDKSAQLAFWIPERSGYVDAAGRTLTMPAGGSSRAAARVEIGTHQIGAIVYDATLISNPEPVRAVGRVVALAVERDRLTAELLASQKALQESRARLVEAADRERRRIAQDLHDGLQPTLVLLALEAQRLGGLPGTPPETAAAAIRLRERIDAAASELREVVHAVMPAPLIERGLAAAARDLADRMPIPVRLDLCVDGVLPRPIATTAYFVLAEGLANTIRHANATGVTMHLSSHEGLLTVEVTDDGVGGAAPGGGLGLRGLTDRVEAVGGWFFVDSPAGLGTRLTARLPCPITATTVRSLVTES